MTSISTTHPCMVHAGIALVCTSQVAGFMQK